MFQKVFETQTAKCLTNREQKILIFMSASVAQIKNTANTIELS